MPGGGEAERSGIDVAGSPRHATYSEDAAGATTMSWTATDGVARSTLGWVIEAAAGGGGITPPAEHHYGSMRSNP